MVPPTVVRRIKGDLGSLQLWVEGCDSYKRLQPKVPQTRQFSRRISRMKMFDNLIFNDDRNTGNFILDESWNIILIDHSRAFIGRKNLLKGEHQAPRAVRQEAHRTAPRVDPRGARGRVRRPAAGLANQSHLREA